MGDLRWTSGGGSTHLRRDARVGATVAFPRYWGQAKGSPEAAKEAQRAPFWMHCFFFRKKIGPERERENGEMLASRNKNGDHRYTKMSETWVFFPKLMMFPSNGSFHSAFAPQVKKYIQSCCWEVQAHQDQLRFQKRTSPRWAFRTQKRKRLTAVSSATLV